MIPLYFPSPREAPADVVRRLRAIDPTATMIWLRRGVWALGTMKPDSRRRNEAEQALSDLNKAGKALAGCPSRRIFEIAIRAWGDKVAWTELKRQGFVHQLTFRPRETPECELAAAAERWLKEATWVRQHSYEATWRALEREMERDVDAEQAEANMLDKARLRDAWRMGFRNPTSVRSAGIPGLKRPGTIDYDPNGVKLPPTPALSA